ncbi:MAG: hypothetical protein Q4A40_04915 [Bacillota bacterium]|nr:hypothetical protein [Bacillota bacterium]
MRSKRWKEKEFSTETLTQVEIEEIMAGSRDYASGKAPVSRNTQYAEGLDDLAELQRKNHERNEMRHTHSYGILNAVRNYNPGSRSASGMPDGSKSRFDSVMPDNDPDTPESFGVPESSAAPEDTNSQAVSAAPGNSDAPVNDSGRTESFGVPESPAAPEDTNSQAVSAAPGNSDAQPGSDDIWKPDSGFFDDEDAQFYNEIEGDNDFALQPLTPEDEDYGDIMENYDDIMEKMSSEPVKPKFWFKEQGDHWFCTCGQLNKGDTCTNCGLSRELLRSLFFLSEPGDEPGKFKGMAVPFTEVEMPKGLSAKAKLLIAISIILILLAGTGLFSYFYIIKPSLEREAAKSAAAAAESMESNVVVFTSDMSTFLRNSYISAGDSCCKTDDFEDAIGFYGMAQRIKDNDEIKGKINNAKYGYVCAHKDKGGEKFEKYLNELYKANYSDIGKIYDEYYAWHFKIVANLDPEDYSTDISTASRNDIIYFHVGVSGGPPGETLDVFYKVKYPSGREEIQQIGTEWKSGSKGTARCMYAVPLLGKEGKLTFTIYDKNTNEALASDSVTLSK